MDPGAVSVINNDNQIPKQGQGEQSKGRMGKRSWSFAGSSGDKKCGNRRLHYQWEFPPSDATIAIQLCRCRGRCCRLARARSASCYLLLA